MEAQQLLENHLCKINKTGCKPILAESIKINHLLLKQPNLKEDVEAECKYNIFEVYNQIIKGNLSSPQQKKSTLFIDRSTQTWSDWQTWCREVIWYGNKKGDYLYGSKGLEKHYAGHF